MKRLNVLLTITILLTSILSYSQSKINWGPKQDEGGIFTLVGESDDLIYVSCTKASKMGFSYEQKLLGFDKSRKITEEINLKDDFQKNNMAIDMFSDGTMRLLALNNKNKKKTKLQIYKVSGATIELESELETFSGQYTFAPNGYENMPFFNGDKSIRIFNSSINDYRAFAKVDKRKKKETFEVSILDPKQSYKTVHSFKITHDNSKKLKVVDDIIIKDDGSAVVIIKEYNGKKDKEKKDKKPNYKFLLHQYFVDGNMNTTEIIPSEGFYKSTVVTHDENGNLYFSTLIENKHDKGADRIAFKKLDSTGKIISDQIYTSKNLPEGKEKLNKYTYSTGLIHCSDDLVLSISQLTDTKSKGWVVGGSSEIKFKDIIVDAFDTNGNYLWSERISRNVTINQHNLLEGLHTFYNEEGATIFLNRHKKNAAESYQKKPKGVKFPSKENVVTAINFDKNGISKISKITPPGEIHIGVHGVKSINGEIYFVGFDRRYKNLRLGILQ